MPGLPLHNFHLKLGMKLRRPYVSVDVHGEYIRVGKGQGLIPDVFLFCFPPVFWEPEFTDPPRLAAWPESSGDPPCPPLFTPILPALDKNELVLPEAESASETVSLADVDSIIYILWWNMVWMTHEYIHTEHPLLPYTIVGDSKTGVESGVDSGPA